MSFIAWTEIQLFHNIRKYTEAYPEILNGNSVVSYHSKVKLHGTNSAVRVYQDGRVIAQSRTQDLVDGSDNAGFAKWVEETKGAWQSIADDSDEDMIIFGEWCGKGVQQSVAVSEIPKKSFVVFAARILNQEDSLITEPYQLNDLVNDIADAYVLPWHQPTIDVDWSKSPEELKSTVETINKWVEEVEKNDPWVESTFGIKGTGEGIVLYPVSKEHLGYKNFSNLCFKAKGEKHKTIKSSGAAQVNPEVAASADQFVDMVLTEARLEQGAANEYDMKNIGKFLIWIANDVQKESKDELQASNLTWEQVSKAVSSKARTWYINKVKSS